MKVKIGWEALRRSISPEKLAERVKRLLRMVLNPRLLLCLAIAWMITNGWSYILFCIGLLLEINWMRIVAGAYMGFLWLPFTPEKLVTVGIAIFLLRLLYPRDRATLGALRAARMRFRRGRSVE